MALLDVAVQRPGPHVSRHEADVDSLQRTGGGAGDIAVRAPLSGTVVAISTTPGSFVAEGQALLVAADLGRLWLEAHVPEHQAPGIGKPSGAWFRVPGSDEVVEVGADAFITVAGRIDPASPTLPVVFAVDNPGEQLPLGAFVEAHLITGPSRRSSRRQHDPMDLRTQADWTLRRRLLAVPGVSQVIVLGGDVRQYQVRVDPASLVAHGLGLEDVAAAVGATNANSSAGFLIEGGQESIIHGIGRVERPEDIASPTAGAVTRSARGHSSEYDATPRAGVSSQGPYLFASSIIARCPISFAWSAMILCAIACNSLSLR